MRAHGPENLNVNLVLSGIVLMCKIRRQILNFWGEFFTVEGQEKYFLVSI